MFSQVEAQRTFLFWRASMNRRSFLSLVPTIALLPVLGTIATHVPSMSLIQRKRLEPDAREVTFADSGTSTGEDLLTGPLQLRSKGSSLWINSVSWQDEEGARHTQVIGKELQPGQGMALPMIGKAQNITFVVACPRVTSATTFVELIAS
jgi:hypothetical protein